MFDPTLLFFIGLAGFLSYRLFTVLGTRGGHEPEDADRYTPMAPRPAEADNTPRPPEAKADETPAEPWVLTVRENYPGFEPKEFIEGAKSAYEMIVQGYASGELK
ncbi:MAG: calcium-binding protein, partial [Pseudomonadota bacterium]